MSQPLLETKLYRPRPRPRLVPRPRLWQQLDEGARGKLTLISAPAGSGKTTLVGEWLAQSGRPAAWLSLATEDGEPVRFLAYLIAALQTLPRPAGAPPPGNTAAGLLQSPQPPPAETVLTALLNELAAFPEDFVLVLDDYHTLEAPAVDQALAFLLDHMPPQMHLLLTTREDPRLPLSRLRARGQLAELRAGHLRFTPAEATAFLEETMGLALSPAEIATLERRTEGWIVGLQLAALALQGSGQTAAARARFVEAFGGSHRYVLDYLLEEVLARQPAPVHDFLLQTSLLERLCAPLCDALTGRADGQALLARLEQANLFLLPLDGERRWYRYHALFRDLLRRRLADAAPETVAELHRRASRWYEAHDLPLEAFTHATAAGEVAGAARLLAGRGVPLHFQGALQPVLAWLESLPPPVLDAHPALWVTYASALTVAGRPGEQVEERLQAAEAALPADAPDAAGRDLLGQIAAIRAMLAVPQNRLAQIVAQSRRALDYLHPDNVPPRTTATWTLGYASQIQGDRAGAARAYADAARLGRESGNLMMTIGATTSLGQLQEAGNRLGQAADGYRQVLALAGEPPLPVACEAHVGLARVLYQWDELAEAGRHVAEAARLARQLPNVDTPAACDLLQVRLQLARGETEAAGATLARAEQFARRGQFAQWLPPIAALRVRLLLGQGDLAAAAALAEQYDLPRSRARVCLAQGDPAGALTLLAEAREGAAPDALLRLLPLAALARRALGEEAQAQALLAEALALAEPAGIVRLFVDEGPPLAALLAESAGRGLAPAYVGRLRAAFPEAEGPSPHLLPEPLTGREEEVLRLLATDLNGPAIARELTISLNTMRTHTKNIYGKLDANSRREALSRARELGLL